CRRVTQAGTVVAFLPHGSRSRQGPEGEPGSWPLVATSGLARPVASNHLERTMRSRVVTAAAAAATSAAGLAPVAGQCQWERFPAPWITGDIHDLKGVDGVAPDDVWAVGTYVDPSTTYQRLKY